MQVTPTKPFVHLHVHTEFSLLDGATRIDDIFEFAFSLGQTAVAITDHGNMFGVLEFCKQAAKFTDKDANFYKFMEQKQPFKVKPIIGCEFYVDKNMDIKQSVDGKAPKFNHIVLLAKNEAGYKNLLKLTSFSHTRGFYYKPRIDMDFLSQHTDGLICLSGCLAGSVPQALLNGNFDLAKKTANEFKKLFKDDYYIELQDHGLTEQKQVIPHLISLARELKIKLVATNDVHYLKKEDWAMQKVLQCISFRKSLDPNELYATEGTGSVIANSVDEDYFPTREFYLKSRDEMEELFGQVLDALDNTQEIVDKCDCYYFNYKNLFPEFDTGSSETVEQMLRRLTQEGLEKKYKKVTKEVKDRAEHELGLIKRLGFVDYFLIVYDFIRHAESIGIAVGPGRGSGVGSIVAYALGITKICPLKYSLLFERFLNPDRVSPPDFDIDFCVDRREEVIEYVVNKYGSDSVSQIVTFGSLKSKAAVKDVGRVFNHPYSEMDKIAKLFPHLSPLKIADLVGKTSKTPNADLKDLYDNDETVRRIFDMAIKVEGFPRQTGIHAAGVIICKDPTYQHIPLAIAKKERGDKKEAAGDDFATTTQFDMKECEQLGLLKMDFLGLRTLTDINKAIALIEKNTGKKIDFYNMEYNDKGVFDLIGEGDTHAVFQLESEGMKRFMKELKPTVFEDIIAGVALFRPGPMDYIPDYVKGKKNPASIKYTHLLLESILGVTYGVMVYQEQVTQVAIKLAGYSASAGDELRYMIGKKQMHLFEGERKVFIHGSTKRKVAGCIKNGVDEKTANKIFDDIIKFGNYAFNKSHSTAYAYLAYQTAYLKKYHTVEFIAAVLNNRINRIDEIANYLRYLKNKKIAVLPPDINKSWAGFSVENGAVRIGLTAIKNVGAGIIEQIIGERDKNGAFIDFEDFISRMSFLTINKRILEGLILTGTFDCFYRPRAQLLQVYDLIVSKCAKDRESSLTGQMSLFDDKSLGLDVKIEYPNVKEFAIGDKLRYEKECSGVYLTGHPLEEYAEFLSTFSFNSTHFDISVEATAEIGGDSEESTDSGVVDEKVKLTDNQRLSLGGMFTTATKKIAKSGNEFGIGVLEDLFGSVEVLIAGRSLTKYRELFVADRLVHLVGSIRYRDDKPSFWIDEIKPVGKDASSVPIKKICFYFDVTDASLLEEIKEILQAYPGVDETFIRSTHDNKLYPLKIGTNICNALVTEISGLVGETGYKIA